MRRDFVFPFSSFWGISVFRLNCFNPLGSRAAATACAAYFPGTRRAVFPKGIVDYSTKLWDLVRSNAKVIVPQCREPTAREKEECGMQNREAGSLTADCADRRGWGTMRKSGEPGNEHQHGRAALKFLAARNLICPWRRVCWRSSSSANWLVMRSRLCRILAFLMRPLFSWSEVGNQISHCEKFDMCLHRRMLQKYRRQKRGCGWMSFYFVTLTSLMPEVRPPRHLGQFSSQRGADALRPRRTDGANKSAAPA